MERHGFESYFIIGEGLLGESGGGRQLSIATTAPPFRFSRMGPSGAGRQLPDGSLKKIAAAMTAGAGSPAGTIPSGFTYLGQFLDHDLTFDKTTVMLGQNVSPAQMLQGRSPALDLDSLYGAGPQDPGSAQFYESDGVHLKMGNAIASGGEPALPGHDLPRVGTGSTNAKKRRAEIPDKRNDENLAVAQTHLAMIRFHNRVVDTLPAATPQAQKFALAREIVTKHYQWMVRTDFLPRVCAAAVVNDVFNNGRKAFEVGAVPTDVPTMPVEFSVAAYRLGHSMIRAAYSWNRDFDNLSGTLDYLFEFSGLSGNLGGSLKLASNWVADFRRLYNFGEANKPALTVPAAKFNLARRIDTKVANPLHNLPSGTVDPSIPQNDPQRNLAFRNLDRGKMVKLATGQQMATFLKSKGVNLTKLTRAQIRDGNGGAGLGGLTTTQRNAVLTNTPLWFYVLREAELNNGRMRGVGGRIIAETFHRAMEGSQFSIVRDTAFKPSLGPNNTTFRMVDLLLFAFEGKANLLNPLGN